MDRYLIRNREPELFTILNQKAFIPFDDQQKYTNKVKSVP